MNLLRMKEFYDGVKLAKAGKTHLAFLYALEGKDMKLREAMSLLDGHKKGCEGCTSMELAREIKAKKGLDETAFR